MSRLWTKSLPCMRFLCAVPSGKWVKLVSPSLCSSSFQIIRQLQPGVIAHRPVVILALDGIGQRLALGVALDAGVVGLHEILPRRIEDVDPRGTGDMVAAGAMALLAADIPFG